MEATFNLAAAGVCGSQSRLLLVGGLRGSVWWVDGLLVCSWLACSLLVGSFRAVRSPASRKLACAAARNPVIPVGIAAADYAQNSLYLFFYRVKLGGFLG